MLGGAATRGPARHSWAEEDPLTIRHEEPDALWSVFESLSYAEQRYDSRSKPMSIFLLKIGPALEVGLPATVVVDRPVIQQILVKHGFPQGTVRIKSRIESFEDLCDGLGVKATLSDGTAAYADVLVGADGVWSQTRKVMHGLGEGAGGFAASGAAGGALDDKEARKLAKDTLKIAAQVRRHAEAHILRAAHVVGPRTGANDIHARPGRQFMAKRHRPRFESRPPAGRGGV